MGGPSPECYMSWVLQSSKVTFGKAASGLAVIGLTPACGASGDVHTFGLCRNLLPEVLAKTPSPDVERATMKNGRPALRAVCAECGTGKYRIGASD